MEASLFPATEIPFTVRFDLLFEKLPRLPKVSALIGRPSFSPDIIMRCLIYKALRSIPTLTELAWELRCNPSLLPILGLDPYKTPPSIERFSHFLRTTDNGILQTIKQQIVANLIDDKVVCGEKIAIDSCPIPIQTKNNNLKTSVKNRYEKSQMISVDPQAKLGIILRVVQPFIKEPGFFWGYRNHVIVDANTEIPLVEMTQPADVAENLIAVSLLGRVISDLNLSPRVVLGDANYDTEKILRFIIEEVKALPVIPRNPRRTQGKNYTFKHGKIYCLADLPMFRKGKTRNKKNNILYCQYCCPLYYGKEHFGYLVCPVGCEKFTDGKGCNVMLRLEPSIRQNIPYDTEFFKTEAKKRSAVERSFSRLLSITMQNPTIYGLNSISNHCTIAHITVLLVALTASSMGQNEKIRYVKSFLPKLK